MRSRSSGFILRTCAIMGRVAKKTLFAGFAPRARRHIVAVLAFDGVVLSDLATPCDVFGRVRDSEARLPYDVRVCGPRSGISTEHLKLEVPWRLTTLRRADTIIVPGIDPLDRSVPEELIRALRRAIARGARVASICTGAFVLARTGALNGLKATTHWRVRRADLENWILRRTPAEHSL